MVIDQGPGFAEDIRDRAFDRFARTDASCSRDSGGSGLGLAIAKGIVEAHRGSIVIEDGPGGRVVVPAPGGFPSSGPRTLHGGAGEVVRVAPATVRPSLRARS